MVWFGTRILTKTHLPDREFAIMLSRETRIARLILDVECSLTRQVIIPIVAYPFHVSVPLPAGCQLHVRTTSAAFTLRFTISNH